jgi:hypothetical protein
MARLTEIQRQQSPRAPPSRTSSPRGGVAVLESVVGGGVATLPLAVGGGLPFLHHKQVTASRP